MSELDNFRVGVLASGDIKTGQGGSTVCRFARDTLKGKVGLTVGVVVCNYPEDSTGVYSGIKAINDEFDLKGDDRIDVISIGPHYYPDGEQKRGQTLTESSAICRLFEQRAIGLASMQGFTRILNGEFIEEWGWKPEYGIGDLNHNGIYHPKARIANNHPAILPFAADTYGHGSHEMAVKLRKAGKIHHTAMTWHLAAAGVDTGPIIHEIPVPICEEDDADAISRKVQAVEKDETSLVIARHLILRTEHLRANS